MQALPCGLSTTFGPSLLGSLKPPSVPCITFGLLSTGTSWIDMFSRFPCVLTSSALRLFPASRMKRFFRPPGLTSVLPFPGTSLCDDFQGPCICSKSASVRFALISSWARSTSDRSPSSHPSSGSFLLFLRFSQVRVC